MADAGENSLVVGNQCLTAAEGQFEMFAAEFAGAEHHEAVDLSTVEREQWTALISTVNPALR